MDCNQITLRAVCLSNLVLLNAVFFSYWLTLWVCTCAPHRAHCTGLGWQTNGTMTTDWETQKRSEILLCQFPIHAPIVPLDSPGIEPSSLLCEAVYQPPPSHPLAQYDYLRRGCSNFPKKSGSHLTITGPINLTYWERANIRSHLDDLAPWNCASLI